MTIAFLAVAFGLFGLVICAPGGRRFASVGFLGVVVGLFVSMLPAVSVASAWGGLAFASAALLLRCPSLGDWPSGLWLSVCIAVCTVLLGFATEAAIVRLGGAPGWLQFAPIVGWALVGAFLARVASRSTFPLEYIGIHSAAMMALHLEGAPLDQRHFWVGILSVSLGIIFSYVLDHKKNNVVDVVV